MSEKDARLEFVAELTLLGFSPERISERLGVSLGIVKRDLQEIRVKWAENRQKSYSEFIEEELATQKLLLRSLEAGIANGSWKHVETALKITERRARVIGLDHADRMDQARVEIESRQIDMISKALEKVMDVLGLNDEEREIATNTLILELEEGDIVIEEEEPDGRELI